MLFSKSFLYSVLVVSSLTSKVVHLSSHRSSLPILLFVLYLPTFFLPDAVIIIGGRLLLSSRPNASLISNFASFIASIIGVVTLFASASQLGFYVETGGEIRWSAAGNFARDSAGLKLLASGSVGVGLCTAGLTFIATLLNPWLYQWVGSLLDFARNVFSRTSSYSQIEQTIQPYQDEPSGTQALTDIEKTSTAVVVRKTLWRVIFVGLSGLVAVLQIVRPRHSPFAHLSTTLPFTLYQIFDAGEAAVCGANAIPIPFPKPELLASLGLGRPALGNSSWIGQHYSVPNWLPDYRIGGFDRFYWQPVNNSDDEWMPYSATMDPLKVSNAEEELLEPLREAFEENDVLIKHVVLFHLESTRLDAFPLTNESHLHQVLAKESDNDMEGLNARLASISENAELLTGVDGHLGASKSSASEGWRSHLREGRGGLNVVGSVTAGTATLKSLIGSICGAQPLPVDFTEEADLTIYQACLPHIFNLFSQGKDLVDGASNARVKVLQRPWRSVHAQAITDRFDRQDVLMDNMGFNQSIARHYPPQEPEANYFGFPETELKPYIRDLFEQAEQEGSRLFLSHLTSTTHHPWSVPESFGTDEEYLSRWGWHEERPLNRYLNTLRYQDRWIGEFMDVLEELDVLDETLVVFAGDHGMAFREDCEALTTFENPHIINFQVPLLFFHPQLPRMQVKASSSSLSILPTILDLLVQSGSLDKHDSVAASDLVREYEGQSLIRPYIAEDAGRESWHFSIINAGAALLSVASAAVPWRLVMPLCKTVPYRFTNLEHDPAEIHPVEAWTMDEMQSLVVGKEGIDAMKWLRNAERMGMWWAGEQKRKWRYSGASLQDDKAPQKHAGVGQLQHDHWWNT
ncbi:uncharacterized protein AB675_11756 [Cyphellophora attinorum]|uniref:Sulfatase N-terminal domain-containing protein n=1 Tax=Cyphellophora attinorum TaxID=1664694 RepID=A0A0N1HJS5_9EURO|nr:uncharacterized protein AB675_11756 [Phialophora attinorum]KPI36814.1 hypothetical protein AB675_11756 [Phialophora attinorum]